MIEKHPSDHDFELIMISVNNNQLSSIISWLEPLVWGFPGAGGAFINQNTLDGGFMKNIFMGTIDNTTNKNRYNRIICLFKNAGFGISEKKDMHNLLWFHFISNASIMTAATKVGSLNELFDSTSALKDFVLILRELIPLMKAKGSMVSSMTNIAVKLPPRLVAFAMKLVLAKGSLPREIMRSASGSESLKAENNIIFARDTLAEARRLGISRHRLEALASPTYK